MVQMLATRMARARDVAGAMGGHARLAEVSWLHAWKPDVLRVVLDYASSVDESHASGDSPSARRRRLQSELHRIG